MLKIEFKLVGNGVETIVNITGNGCDVVSEVICFHKDHADMLRELIDKLPLQLMVLLGLLDGDDEKDD